MKPLGVKWDGKKDRLLEAIFREGGDKNFRGKSYNRHQNHSFFIGGWYADHYSRGTERKKETAT